jgi:hypothetical protein
MLASAVSDLSVAFLASSGMPCFSSRPVHRLIGGSALFDVVGQIFPHTLPRHTFSFQPLDREYFWPRLKFSIRGKASLYSVVRRCRPTAAPLDVDTPNRLLQQTPSNNHIPRQRSSSRTLDDCQGLDLARPLPLLYSIPFSLQVGSTRFLTPPILAPRPCVLGLQWSEQEASIIRVGYCLSSTHSLKIKIPNILILAALERDSHRSSQFCTNPLLGAAWARRAHDITA